MNELNKILSTRHSMKRTSIRLNSIDNFSKFEKIKQKNTLNQIHKSHSSFDESSYKKNINLQLPQLRLEKQIQNNIHFNKKSKNDYLKKIIDGYFSINQENNSSKVFVKKLNNQSNSYSLGKKLRNANNKILNKINFSSQNNSLNNQEQKSIFQSKLNQNSILIKQKKISKEHNIKNVPPISSRYNQDESMRIYENKNKNIDFHNQKMNNIQIFNQFKNLSTSQVYDIEQSNTKYNDSSYLVKITEYIDDWSEQQNNIQISQTVSNLFNQTDIFQNSNTSLLKKIQEKKERIFQNSIFNIYISKDNGKKAKIKQFKKRVFMQRYQKIQRYIMKKLWNHFKYDDMSIVTPYIYSLKKYLCQLKPHPNKPNFTYVIPKSLHKKLVANRCQQLFIAFKQFIKQFLPISQKLINNKINPSNLFYLKGQLHLSQWQYSAIREQNQIQGNHFESRVQPILIYEKQWLVPPQYLAPQILLSIQNPKMDFDLWEYENVSDVYSLGLTFLQIITLVPIYIQDQSIIKQRFQKPRIGCLATSNRSISRILQKQKQLKITINQILQKQIPKNEQNPQFFKILLQMIQYDRSKRIKFQQILHLIK